LSNPINSRKITYFVRKLIKRISKIFSEFGVSFSNNFLFELNDVFSLVDQHQYLVEILYEYISNYDLIVNKCMVFYKHIDFIEDSFFLSNKNTLNY